jgi:hypothetical protein
MQCPNGIAGSPFTQAGNDGMHQRRQPRTQKRDGKGQGNTLVLQIALARLPWMRQEQTLKHYERPCPSCIIPLPPLHGRFKSGRACFQL